MLTKGEQIFENFGNESAMEIIYERIVEYYKSQNNYEQALWYYELLIEQLKKKKMNLEKENMLNNDKILKYEYKIFNQLRGHLTIILYFLKTNPDIDIRSCYKKALDTCEELKISYDNLNLKEIIRMKIRIKEATIQTNLD